MMKAAIFTLLLALLCSYAEAGAYEAKCSPFAKCGAKASVKIKLVGEGKCEATAGAYCSAFTKSSNDCFKEKTLYVDMKKCRDEKLEIDAKCWARAAAKAYAKAAVETKCVAEKPKYSFACGAAEADAKAVACAVAEAIVKLGVSVGDDNAVCEAEVAAAIDAFAAAAASATAQACSVNGIPAVDSEEALAHAIERVVVKVLAKCVVYCDTVGKKVEAKAEADGSAVGKVVKEVEKVEVSGGGVAKATAGN